MNRTLPRTPAQGDTEQTFGSQEIEAGAKAWLEWQFPGNKWDTASDTMKAKFRVGVSIILNAVSRVKMAE